MSTELVYDVTEADFEAKVLQRSFEVPVVVDFWAGWCHPCHALGPVLERAVLAREGEVELARVDVDQAPQLAAAFGVQGIPAVKAVVDGRLVDEFVGAQPAPVVEQFIEALVPSQADRVAAEAAGLDPEAAATRYREILQGDPSNVAARVGLARLALDRDDPAEAMELLAPVGYEPEAAEPLARARLAVEASDPGSSFGAAARRATNGQPDQALAELLAAVREGPGERRERARELMLDVFRMLGDDHPLSRRYRRELTTALF
ncbi:MAG TPA: tetratricopeptide repeat protein [Actinomycetes bacterium]|jgi:putative thioredoxin|nr:tetratricopeptide repeat protein [Actinomycetes bacterium]